MTCSTGANIKSTNLLAISILMACWNGICHAKPANSPSGRCPDSKTLIELQETFNTRRLMTLELYSKQQKKINGTAVPKHSLSACYTNSDYENAWQLGDKNFQKRLFIGEKMLIKATHSLHYLRHRLLKNGELDALENGLRQDVQNFKKVISACHQPIQFLNIKKAMDGDFLNFPLSKEKASACTSQGQLQQFLAELIQFCIDMYNSIGDFRSQ